MFSPGYWDIWVKRPWGFSQGWTRSREAQRRVLIGKGVEIVKHLAGA